MVMAELEALSFEDRIAQLVMAVLYSASHIEITTKIGAVENKQNKIMAAKEAVRARGQATFDAFNPTTFAALAETAGISSTAIDYAASRLQVKEPVTRKMIARFHDFFKVHGGVNKASLELLELLASSEAEVLVRGTTEAPGGPEEPATPVSEIDYDTTAVAINGTVMVFGCNFKLRTMGGDASYNRKKSGFEYLDFGHFSANTINLVKAALRTELDDVRANGQGDESAKARRIDTCHIIGTTPRPTDETENSRPHAEMQVLKYLTDRGWTGDGGTDHVGVSRGCCPRCGDHFASVNIRYTRRHAVTPRAAEWIDPGQLTVASLHTFPI